MDRQTEGSGGDKLDHTIAEIAQVLSTLDQLRAQIGERAVEALRLEERWALNIAAAALHRAAQDLDSMAVHMPPDERRLPPEDALWWRLLGPEFRPPQLRLDPHREILEVTIVEDTTLCIGGTEYHLSPDELFIFNQLYISEWPVGSSHFARLMQMPYESIQQAQRRVAPIVSRLAHHRLEGVVVVSAQSLYSIARNVLFVDDREQPVPYDQQPPRYVPASWRQPPQMAAPSPAPAPPPEVPPAPPEKKAAKKTTPKKAVKKAAPKKTTPKKERPKKYTKADITEIAELARMPLHQVQLFMAHQRAVIKQRFGPTTPESKKVGEVYRPVDMYSAEAVAWIVGELQAIKERTEQARRQE